MVLRALFPNPHQNLRLCHKPRPLPRHTLLRWQHPRQIRMVLRALSPNPLQNLRLCHKLRPFPHQRHKLRRRRTVRPFQNPHPPHTLRLFQNLPQLPCRTLRRWRRLRPIYTLLPRPRPSPFPRHRPQLKSRNRLFPKRQNLLMLRIHLRFSAVKNPLFFSSVGSR